jgi:hypothetical protein
MEIDQKRVSNQISRIPAFDLKQYQNLGEVESVLFFKSLIPDAF